jgi:diguanylate cyclase (GGDEF)-like protein/PAS domain S-box-containing protein
MKTSLSAALRTYLSHLEAAPEVFRRAWDAIAIYDLDGRLVVGNSAARKLVGDELAQSLAGAHFSAHLPLGEATAAARLFAQVATTGEPINTEGAFREADGSPIPVMVRLVPARLDGKIVGVIGFARDLRAQRGVEAQFVRSEQQFRSIFENHPDALAMLDVRSRFTRINRGTERLTGYRVDELIGERPELLSPTGHWEDEERIVAAMLRGEAAEYASTIRTKSGELRDVEGRAVPLTSDGEVRGFYLIARDVTEERRRERQAERHAERIAELYRIASEAAFSAADKIERALATGMRELDGDWAYVGRVVDGVLIVTHTAGLGTMAVGHTVSVEKTMVRRLLGGGDMLVVEDTSLPPFRDELGEHTKNWRGIVACPLAVDGALFGVVAFTSSRGRLRISPTDRDYVRAIAALIGSASHQLVRDERLDTLAFHDPLTGLANRALFHDRLEQTLLSARRNRRSFAAHYIDIDHFKTINDTYGHHVGDAMLVAVGNWLRATLRDSDTIARIGGDEFVVLQPEIDSQQQAEELAARLVAIRDHPFHVGDAQLRVTISVGGAVFPADARNPVDLLRSADEALYQVKANGRDGYSVGTVDA